MPRVSPYRLAAHLTTAILIYAGLLWTTLSVAFPQHANAAVSAAPQSLEALTAARQLRLWLLPLAGVVGITALSGESHPWKSSPAELGKASAEMSWTASCCDG